VLADLGLGNGDVVGVAAIPTGPQESATVGEIDDASDLGNGFLFCSCWFFRDCGHADLRSMKGEFAQR
jgi:hypothetical protein